MTPEEILSYPAKVLTKEQRESYFTKGFVSVPELVPNDILGDLQRNTKDFVEQSKNVTQSDDRFDIGPDHTKDKPVLRRLKSPDTASEVYWSFSKGLMAEVAEDLVGPNVIFHHSKLNFKWFDASDTVKWHQDIQFFPHANYYILTIGCYLSDTTMDNGPLAALP